MSGSNVDPVGEGMPNGPLSVKCEGCVDWCPVRGFEGLWAVRVGDEGNIDRDRGEKRTHLGL